MTSVTNEQAQRLRQDEDVVIIVLVDLEDLWIRIRSEDLVRKSDWLSVNSGGVQVVEFNLVFTKEDGDSELVVGDLLSKNKVSWGISTISRDESWALRHIGVVGEIVISLDSTRSNITVAVDSVLHGKSVEWRESGENWSLQWSGEETEVNSVEVFIFSLRAVEVDIGFWVFFIESNIQLDGSLDVLAVSGSSVITVSVVKGSINLIAGDVVWHKESSSNDSWVSPALAGLWVDSVVDGDISFTEGSLLECSPYARLSCGGQISRVFWTVLGFITLFVRPTVGVGLILLSLRSVSNTDDFDSGGVGWAGWAILSGFLFSTPDDVDGAFVSGLILSFVVKEVSDLGTDRVNIDTDNSGLISGFVTSGGLDLDINLLPALLDEGDGGINVLGLGDSSGVLGVEGSLSLDLNSSLFLRIHLNLSLDLSFNLVVDRLGSSVLHEVSLHSTGFGGWGKEQGLQKVASSKTKLGEWSTEASTEVLVLRSEEFTEGTDNMETGMNLLAVVVLDSSLDSFHELVLVSRSELTSFTVFLSLGDLSVSLALWASLVEKVNNFIVVEGSWGITQNGGEGGGVNLGEDGIFLSWCVDDKVDGVLLEVDTNAHVTWDTGTEGTDGADGVSASESWKMVVDGGLSVNVELEAEVVVPGKSGSSLLRGNLGVETSNGGDSADDGNWGSEFIGFLNGGSSDEQHAVEFLVISGVLEFAQLLDELWNGGDSLGISGMISNNTVVEHDGDFNPEWFGMTILNTNVGEDFLNIIKVNDASGHGHNSVSKSLAKSLKTDEERQIVGGISSGLTVESEVDGTWEDRQSRLLD